MSMTGAQILWESLHRLGVEVVFGYPGGAILPAYDALLDAKVRHVLARHEQGAAHMADGYARASGRTGVVVSTSGPGATNLVTGLATAMLDSIPMVAVCGQVNAALLGTDGFQEVDITGVTLPITKHNYLVRRPEDIAPALREAFALAQQGRPGPVLVDITKDAQQAKAALDWEAAAPTRHLRHLNKALSSAHLEEAARLIQEAERPVILAGQGIIHAGATSEVLALAEGHDVPLASTLLGLGGVPASHPLFLGMMGMHGEAWVNQAIQDADLLIALGMRFDDRATGNLATYAPRARKLQIEIDPSELNKNVRVDVCLLGDLKEVLQQLLPRLSSQRRTAWLQHIDAMKGAESTRDMRAWPDNGHLYAPHVMHDLWQATSGEALLVTDVGQHQMWAAQYYAHNHPRTALTSGGFGTMGFALPAAIGAKVARPEASVWAVAGDGGIQMNLQELMVLQQEQIKVNVAIINNGFLGMVRQWQEFFYDRRYSSTPLLSPDFLKVADAYGLKALRVTRREEVMPAIHEAHAHPGSVVVEFQVEQEDAVYPMVPSGAALHDMIRRPSPVAETGSAL